jgi:integrase
VKATGGELVNYTVKGWLDGWLKGRLDASPATVKRYERILSLFYVHLGPRAERGLTTLQPAQVESFRDYLHKKQSPSTANLAIKVLKAAFASAVAKRQLEFSPAQHIAKVATEESKRRPFTLAEINKLLAAADDEWKTMVMLGFYTGQRLSDCTALTWRAVDLTAGSIALTTAKTKRRIVLPLAKPLLAHLMKLAGDNPDAPLCPTLHGSKPGPVSGKFYNILVAAGLAPHRRKDIKTGAGRSGRRQLNELSFHSLRHSAVSELKNAGVSEAIAMDLVGHESAAISRHYTKIADGAKRDALNKLPDVTL